MDMAAANLIEPGDRALVANSGFFGDRMGAILERYGAQVTHVRAAVGGVPDPVEVAAALAKDSYKLLTITQVDTSTGVLTDVKALAAAGQAHGALVVVDGVCSVAGEALPMADWGVDLAFTASQKAIGVPPGLRWRWRRPAALAAFKARKTPVGSYYADWTNWLPIMEAYEARKPSYFGTPAVNLVWALNVSLGQILAEGMDARIARHVKLGQRLPGGDRGAGAGPGAADVCDRGAHDDRPALPCGRRRSRPAEVHRRRGRHAGRRPAPRHPHRVFPHRPHGPDDAERCTCRGRGDRTRPEGVRLPLQARRGGRCGSASVRGVGDSS